MMKKSPIARCRIILLIWILALLGCRETKTFTDLDEFEKYVRGEDFPYLQTITKNGIKVSLRYMPTEAMMISAYRHYLETREKFLKDTSLSEAQRLSKLNDARNELAKRRRTYHQSLYFHLTMGYEDASKDIVYEKMRAGYGAYSRWLQKLMFALQEYIYLQSAAIDKIPLDTYHMERTFGMRKSRTFLLMFPTQFNEQAVLGPRNKWLKLWIKEFGLGTGPLTYKFKLPFKKVDYQVQL